MVKYLKIASYILASLTLLLACSKETKLSPGVRATEVPGSKNAAIETVAGVRMIVESNVWTGDEDVTDVVTPIKVKIKNKSGKPLRIRYTDFALVSVIGERYSALPLYNLEKLTVNGDLVDVNDVVSAPDFEFDDFLVAPDYSSFYPSVPPHSDPFFRDKGYYQRYFFYWQDTNLPTQEMRQRVLPEGVLNSGGFVSGFLYFEKVDDREPRVRFRADLVNDADSDVFGTILIPFSVEVESAL